MTRDILKNKKRIVLKIGTSSLTFPNGKLNFTRIEHLCSVIAKLKSQEKDVVLVSSGSIAVGIGKLGKKKRPSTIPEKQAMAALGQAVLAKIYRKFFDKHEIHVGQVLLTYDVIQDDIKHSNAENTFAKLLELGTVPIVNENDTVATDEIEIGDNDRLSAMVATICKADLLIMLSDIDGLFDANPKSNPDAKRIPIVTEVDESITAIAGSAGSDFGTGGMSTKINAVEICNAHGIDTVIANANEPEIVYNILNGEDVGTLFIAPKK
jgi:glutamate 5-kinase